jgi:beta-glucuronidase
VAAAGSAIIQEHMTFRRSLRTLSVLGTAVLTVAGAAAVLALGDARGASSAVASPTRIQLSHGWQFQLDPARQGLAAGWQRGAGGGVWQTVTVPHVFDPRPRASLFSGTTGWYRLSFPTPSTPAGFGWGIRFEQARRIAEVWLNGRLLGVHVDPYTPFQIPLPLLQAGAANELVVRVDNRKGLEPREGWWNWGGLTRPVSLVPLGPLQVTNLGLIPQVTCATPLRCLASVLVDGTVTNRSSAPSSPALTVSLTPPDGGSAQTATIHLPVIGPHQSEPVHTSVPVDGPVATWSPEQPRLYSARVETFDASTLAQRDELQIGMRQIQVRNGLLYLNDRPIDLRGASIEEDMPGHGPALSAGDVQRILSELRAIHANVTRAQYPLNPALLDAFDRAGILVWSQAPIYHRDELLLTRRQRGAALATLRGTLLATRNHPSVVTQSVANELSPTPDVVPATRAYIDAAVPLARALDPGVPVALDVLSYPNFPLQKTYRQFEVLGINNYFGWYAGKRGHSTASFAGLAPYLRTTHARYPDQALVMSEFGAEASVSGPSTEKQTYAFQTRYLVNTLNTVGSLPFMSGAIYWTLREFAVKPHWDGGAHRTDVPHTSIHHKGLITYGGRPKPAFNVAAQMFAQTPLYRAPSAPSLPAAPVGGGPSGPSWMLPLLVLSCLIAMSVIIAARPRVLPRLRRSRPVPRIDSANA